MFGICQHKQTSSVLNFFQIEKFIFIVMYRLDICVLFSVEKCENIHCLECRYPIKILTAILCLMVFAEGRSAIMLLRRIITYPTKH